MIPFIKHVAEMLKDRQQFQMTAMKIENDLVMTVIPDFKGSGHALKITIPEEDINRDDIDHVLFEKLNTPVPEEKATLQAQKVEGEDPEEEEEEEPAKTDLAKKKEQLAAARKLKSKRAPAKKDKKAESENQGDAQHKNEVEEMRQDEIPAEEPQTPEIDAPAEDPITEAQNEQPTVAVQPDPKPEPEGPSPKELFAHFMEEGKRLHDERKYRDAEAAYKSALKIFPEDKNAKDGAAKADQWAKAVERMAK